MKYRKMDLKIRRKNLENTYNSAKKAGNKPAIAWSSAQLNLIDSLNEMIDIEDADSSSVCSFLFLIKEVRKEMTRLEALCGSESSDWEFPALEAENV